MTGHADKQSLGAAVRQLRNRFPDADPALIVRAVLDAHHGLSAFGFRGDEQSVALLTRVALTDPRLPTGLSPPGDRGAT